MDNRTRVLQISGYGSVVESLDLIRRSQLRFGVSKALNDLAYKLAENERKVILQTFDSVVPFTEKSPLYTKSTKSDLSITLFHRDQAGKGTDPATYLYPQVEGGEVYVTGFTRKLRYADLISPREYAAHWAPIGRPKFTGGRLNQILHGVGASGPGLGRQGPRTAKLASKYMVLGANNDERRRSRERKDGEMPRGQLRLSGFRGPGIYERRGKLLEKIISIYDTPLRVKPKYDWSEQRIGGLADKWFSGLLDGVMKNL